MTRFTLVSGGRLMKPALTQSRPQSIQIRTEQRRGHPVSVVAGIEPFQLDADSLAVSIKVVCACSTTIERIELKSGQVKKEIMVQGFKDQTIATHLEEVWGIPADFITTQTGAGRKEKAAKATGRKVHTS
jgi:translation initiation factor 1 (eIF-1/SUI1)